MTRQTNIPYPLHLMQTVLARSSSHGLTFHYDYWPNLHGCSPYTTEIFSLLTEQSHRWEEAFLSISPSFLYLLNPIRGRLNRLQELTFVYCKYDISTTDSTPSNHINAFETAQVLSVVRLFGLPQTTTFHVPWSTLLEFCDD